MKEIVWVYGNSAAGKETLIKHIVNGDVDRLIDDLGWTGKVVAACQASISHIGQFDKDPVTLRRDDILTEVPELLKSADVVLIKWQTVDSEAGRVERLTKLLPMYKHRIILLSTPRSELAKRLPKKSWWDDDDTHAFIAEEHDQTMQELENLKSRYDLVTVNWTSEHSYSLSDLMPS